MKYVWIVGVGDCEGSSVYGLYETKKSAEKALFGIRDDLVKRWQKMIEFNNKEYNGAFNSMYEPMIQNLSNDDYENWDNYPHDCPYMYKEEVLK